MPLLHRPKPQKPSNPLPISMPTNLNHNELMNHNNSNDNNNTTTQNEQQSNNKNSLPTNNNLPMNFNEVSIIFPGPQLPSLSINNRSVKANLARQVTNVIKRHNGIIPDNATR